jgi:hypothetical protein
VTRVITLAVALSVALLFNRPAAEAMGPVLQASPTQEWVVADMAIQSLPSYPRGEGHCIFLSAGQLTATLQLVGEAPDRPVSFTFFGYRGADPNASIELRPIAREAKTLGVPLTGGLYCYSLLNETPVSATAPLAELTSLAQRVWLRMVVSAVQ